jgi:hypothetical protein
LSAIQSHGSVHQTSVRAHADADPDAHTPAAGGCEEVSVRQTGIRDFFAFWIIIKQQRQHITIVLSKRAWNTESNGVLSVYD